MSENNSTQLMKQFSKEFGDEVIHTGDQVEEGPRFSTGVFAMDLALGGGLPKGHATQIYGKQDSGKSLLVYSIIAHHQKEFPEEKCVLIDIESNFEKSWAEQIGIDTQAIIIVTPDHVANAIDMIEGLLYAEDVGLIVIDSVGAMMTQNELESSADKMAVGGASLLVSKMMRKITIAQSKIRRLEDRHPSVILINQVRVKIGQMYGDPDHLPGGSALQYAVNCTIRLYGKPVMDKKVHDAIPVKLETTATIKKYKFPITNQAFKYDIITYAHNGYKVGSCYDWNTVSHYLKDLGYLKKARKGAGYTCLGENFKTISELKFKALEDFAFYSHLKSVITQTVLEKNKVLSEPVSKKTDKE